MFVTFLTSSQNSFSIVGIPLLSQEQGYSAAQSGALISAFPLFAAVSSFLAGPLSDFAGRKRTLLAGLLSLSVPLLLHPYANAFESLLTLRAWTGLGAGMLTGLPSVMVSDTISNEKQHAHIGRNLCGYALGHTLGIPLGIWLFDHIGYLGLNAWLGGLALCLALVALFQFPTRSFHYPRPRHSLKTYFAEALQNIRQSELNHLLLSGFTSFVATSLFYVGFTIWLYEEAGLRPAQISPMYAAAGIIQIIVFAYRIRRKEPISPYSLALRSYTINISLYLLFALIHQNVLLASLTFAFTIGSVAIRIPPIQYLATTIGPHSQKGLRMSLLQSSNHIGKAAGTAFAGILFHTLSHAWFFTLSAALLLIPTFLFLQQKKLQANEMRNSDVPHQI